MYAVLFYGHFFDKNGHSVSHQFYFSSWQAALVARIQNANDVINLASRALTINALSPDQTNKETDICGQFLTKSAIVLATSSFSPVGERRW